MVNNKLIFGFLLLQSVGVLLPFNAFQNAYTYFVNYKLANSSGAAVAEYRANFDTYILIISELTGLIASLMVILLCPVGGLFNYAFIRNAILTALVMEFGIYILTLTLALLDTSDYQELFFWITMCSGALLTAASSVHQNSLFTIAAALPPAYLNAVLVGINTCGTLVAILNIICQAVGFTSPAYTAVMFFSIACFFLCFCIISFYCVAHTSEFSSYVTQQQSGVIEEDFIPRAWYVDYLCVCRLSWESYLALFLLFFTTLTIRVYPGIQVLIQPTSAGFLTSWFIPFTVFFTFNFSALLGNCFNIVGAVPKPRTLLCVVVVRQIFLTPLFVFSNVRPLTGKCHLPVYIHSDVVILCAQLVLGGSSGYLSSKLVKAVAVGVPLRLIRLISCFCLLAGIFVGAIHSHVLSHYL